MTIRPLTEIKRQPVEAVLAGVLSDSGSADAGLKLVAQAKSFGLNMRDYLRLAVDVRAGEHAESFSKAGLNGYEAALAFLKLPVKDDLDAGVVLQLASDTFNTYPGTRAMFPEVIDDVVKWKYRQDVIEKTEGMLANRRTINGAEMISTVVDDGQGDYVNAAIPELGRIPMRSIRTTQNAVGIFKHGSGYKVSYEFARRASLDLMTPYANRTQRELEMSKVKFATLTLLNGDGVNAAAPVVAQSSFNTPVGSNSTNNFISYKHFLAWLVARAQTGVPVDTVVGNWDAYLQWILMFAVPTTANSQTDVENLAKAGVGLTTKVPILNFNVGFQLSSSAPANKLIGFSRGDTLEELFEAGSSISESERAIGNQSIQYVRTENTGYRLVFGDTRSVFNFGG